MIATVVETKDLLQTVLFSTVAGVGLTFAFSMAIWGATRFVDLSGDERPLAAALAAILAVVCLLICLAAVAFGLIVMTSK
jgi:hypothetical protein